MAMGIPKDEHFFPATSKHLRSKIQIEGEQKEMVPWGFIQTEEW